MLDHHLTKSRCGPRQPRFRQRLRIRYGKSNCLIKTGELRVVFNWPRVATMVIVGALALCTTETIAQEQIEEEWEFIPAADEPCGVNCPDPDAPLSGDNYPPRDDNFKEMFVSTESGLRIVRNPHWNGTEPTGEWCGILCRDPYSPVYITNPFRRNDAERTMFVFARVAGDVVFRSRPNPDWVGRNDTIETIEYTATSAPLPLLGLGAWSSEIDFDAEELGSEVVSGSMDRGGVVYHATGSDVFGFDVLQNIGGVLSQGSVAEGLGGQVPKVEFALRPDGTYPGYVLVSDDSVSLGRYRIRYDELVPMALFVDSGGTSLYTLWSEDRLPELFQREAGFARNQSGPGFLAVEFAATRYAEALHFLDTCQGCVRVPDHNSEAHVNGRPISDGERPISDGEERSSSYINVDLDSSFEVVEKDSGSIDVAVTGGIVRFIWSGDADNGVSIHSRLQMARPGELRAMVNRWLAEREDEHILRLMFGNDIRRESSVLGRRRLEDAFFLFETLALLRATKLHSPEDWSAFMTVLSSELLVRQNREPWERYTKTYCDVYTVGRECSGNRAQP